MQPARALLVLPFVAAAILGFRPESRNAQQGVGLVRGVVTGQATGQPVAAAEVSPLRTGLGTLTNADGVHELNLPQSTHRIHMRRVALDPAVAPQR